MSGTFSEDYFNEKATEFANISKKVNDTWTINEKDSKIYLSKKQVISIQTEASSSQEEIITIEYHVVFHSNYQVPVLYFNAFRDNGSLLNLEDVSRLFMQDYEPKKFQHEIHKIISQADHPVLFRPFYMIHPCHIHEVLSKFPESKNFILTFLSIFGPSLRLKISNDYEKFYSI